MSRVGGGVRSGIVLLGGVREVLIGGGVVVVGLMMVGWLEGLLGLG